MAWINKSDSRKLIALLRYNTKLFWNLNTIWNRLTWDLFQW